jgi:hypothetical protein
MEQMTCGRLPIQQSLAANHCNGHPSVKRAEVGKLVPVQAGAFERLGKQQVVRMTVAFGGRPSLLPEGESLAEGDAKQSCQGLGLVISEKEPEAP